ncbi:MAG: PD40 domain-containing protein [Ardenticatenaceae bacterium]|nr:PD40 domain-containing protein [Ardenticatenaceae bacterium]
MTEAAIMTAAVPQPTETLPPPPTLPPTPIVTPIPTAIPPLITLPDGQTPQPFTIVYKQGDVISAIDSDGTNQRSLLNVQATLGLHLPIENLARFTGWASPSPDGEQLALILGINAEQPPTYHIPIDYSMYEFSIYLLNLHTDEIRFLVADAILPLWSPDGTHLVYRHATTGSLWLVEIASGQIRELYAVSPDEMEPHAVTQLSWSPDGQNLVFIDESPSVSRDIVVVNVDQTQPPRVILSAESYPVTFPQWSPDGTQILFVSPVDQATGFSETANLWLISPDGEQQKQLTQYISVGIGGIPHWSPDGLWIAFAGAHAFEELEPRIDLWLVAKDGTNIQRLTSNLDGKIDESRPLWSPDSTQLVFHKDQSELWVISLVDGSQTQMPVSVFNFVDPIALP